MKKLLYTLSMVLVSIAMLNFTNAQEFQSGAVIEFEKDVLDFGTIKQYSSGTYEFKFSNTGNEPLTISKADGSCNCTVPEWPKEPIAPGESGVIKVKYDTKRVGSFGKSVKLQSNATNEPTKTLRIKGKVEKASSDRPVNKSGAPSN